MQWNYLNVLYVAEVHWELIYLMSFNSVTSLCHESKSCNFMNMMLSSNVCLTGNMLSLEQCVNLSNS